MLIVCKGRAGIAQDNARAHGARRRGDSSDATPPPALKPTAGESSPARAPVRVLCHLASALITRHAHSKNYPRRTPYVHTNKAGSKFFTSLFDRSRGLFSESTPFKCKEKDKSCGRTEKKSIPFNWPVNQVNWVRGTKRVKGYVTCNGSTDIERSE